MHCTTTGCGVPSDGTLTQDPQLYRSQLVPRESICWPLIVQKLLCAEMEARTRLVCDALTYFQRIASLCVAERHGRWAMSLADNRPRSGWYCPKCGFAEEVSDSLNTQGPIRTSVEVCREPFLREGSFTPVCNEIELQRQQQPNYRYINDAAILLEHQNLFHQEYGSLLQRIKSASKGIQESVTR